MIAKRFTALSMLATAALAAVLTTSAFAQPQAPNAALQARARMKQNHQQNGTIGGAYRPLSARTYQNSARLHAQVLNSYGTTLQQLPPATAREHLTEVQRNVTALKKEVEKLQTQVAQDAELKVHYDSMLKHLAQAESMCTMIGQTIGGETVQAQQMCAHCMNVEKELSAFEADHQELLKKVGIELPSSAPAAGHEQHAPPARP